MQNIVPNLWFDNQSGQTAGALMAQEVTLEGFDFAAFNGGPHFQMNPSISFIVNCRELSDRRGNRSALARADGRRPGPAVRLAEGQIRRQMADRPRAAHRAPVGDRPRHQRAHGRGAAGDAEDRRRGAGGCRRGVRLRSGHFVGLGRLKAMTSDAQPAANR